MAHGHMLYNTSYKVRQKGSPVCSTILQASLSCVFIQARVEHTNFPITLNHRSYIAVALWYRFTVMQLHRWYP